jgi:hypothetical protein
MDRNGRAPWASKRQKRLPFAEPLATFPAEVLYAYLKGRGGMAIPPTDSAENRHPMA